MNKYFLNELDSLRDIAKEFSLSNPTLAPQLAQTSSDPDVERVLEGVAFLTAGIREKIDDDFPEFSQSLLNQIFPHYLRPIPSATIIEFTPTPILKSTLASAAGAYLDSVVIDEVQCRYKTTAEVDVSPISVTDAKIHLTATGRQAIDFTLTLKGMSMAAWDVERLRLHIAGDYQGAVDTFFILNHSLESIALIDAQGDEIAGDELSLIPVGMNDDFKLLDYPSNSFPAYRLIQEYLLLKEKFLFFDLVGLNKYTKQLTGSSFSVRFYLKELTTQVPKLSPSRFVLHATPAVNLFKHEAESFVNDYKRSDYQLRPMRNTKNQYAIYSVDSVLGHSRTKAEKTQYMQMGLFDPDKNTAPIYQTYTRAVEADLVSNYISFSYPQAFDLESMETVQVELTCSNGQHTSKIKAGDISKKTSTSSELMEFSNIIAPSESQSAPTGHSVLWRLLSHLAINYLSLADADNLKSLLELYIFSDVSGGRQEVANRKRIDSISEVTVQPCDRLVGGTPIRGQAVNVTVDPKSFVSKGDMYLFGMLLDRLMGSFASLNCFTEFSLIDSDTNEIYSWPIRAGEQPLV